MTLMERIAIKLGIAPKPIFDAIVPAAKAKAIFVANKLTVFDKLSNRWLSAEELAKEVGASERSLTMLLKALAAVGYLKYKNDKYTNAKIAQQWLVEGSTKYVGNFLRHFDDLWTIWGGLEESVRADKPVVNGYQYFDEHPKVQRNFTLGMKDIATTVADQLVSKVKLPQQARKLLDLGGAHGYYSVAFCHKHAQLSALVLDWEKPVQIGKEVVEQEKMSHRVAFKVTDYMTDDIGSGYDIALLFALLHDQPPDSNQTTIKKVYAALNPGGNIAIAEVLSYRGKKESNIGLLFALNMLACTPRGETYSYDEVKRWLQDAGFTGVKRADLRHLPGYSLVLGTKPT
jgi:biotin operon repressor